MITPARTLVIRAVGSYADDAIHGHAPSQLLTLCGQFPADAKRGDLQIGCPGCAAAAPYAVAAYNSTPYTPGSDDSRDSTPVPGAGEAGVFADASLRARPAQHPPSGPAPTPDNQPRHGEVVGPGAASPVPGPTADMIPDEDWDLPGCGSKTLARAAVVAARFGQLVHDALAPYRRH